MRLWLALLLGLYLGSVALALWLAWERAYRGICAEYDYLPGFDRPRARKQARALVLTRGRGFWAVYLLAPLHLPYLLRTRGGDSR